MKDILFNLNKVFSNNTRLGIMTILMVDEWVDFNTFKSRLGVTDGNLASHLKHLEGKKYIDFKKQFVGRKPQTLYHATPIGAKAFNDHLDALEQLLNNRK